MPARNAATDSTGDPLTASRVSPTVNSDRAAELPGTILAIRTWFPGAGSAVTPRNGRRGKESEESDAFPAAAAGEHGEARTIKQPAINAETMISSRRPMTLPQRLLFGGATKH